MEGSCGNLMSLSAAQQQQCWAYIHATAENGPTHNLRYDCTASRMTSRLWVIAASPDRQALRYQCLGLETLAADVEHCSQFYLTPTHNAEATECKIALKAGPRHADAAGRVIIWRHLKPIFFKLLGLGQGWRTLLTVCAKTTATIIIIIPVILAPLISWCLGSCPAGVPLSSVLQFRCDPSIIRWKRLERDLTSSVCNKDWYNKHWHKSTAYVISFYHQFPAFFLALSKVKRHMPSGAHLKKLRDKRRKAAASSKKVRDRYFEKKKILNVFGFSRKTFLTNAKDESDVFKGSENKSTLPHFLESVITENNTLWNS